MARGYPLPWSLARVPRASGSCVRHTGPRCSLSCEPQERGQGQDGMLVLWCGQGVAPGKVRAGDCVTLGQVSNSLALNSTASTCQGPRASDPRRGPGGRCCPGPGSCTSTPLLWATDSGGDPAGHIAAQVDRFQW